MSRGPVVFDQTTIRVDRNTNQRLKLLAGDQPVATWLRDLSRLMTYRKTMEPDILDQLTEQIENFGPIDEYNWPRYKMLVELSLPVGIALDSGKRYVDADVFRKAIEIIEENPATAGWLEDHKNDVIRDFKRELAFCLDREAVELRFLASFEPEAAVELKKLLFDKGDGNVKRQW